MRYRFYITALSSRIEVFPLNHWKTSLVDERDDGKVYYRRKFSGSLQFTDNNGGMISAFTSHRGQFSNVSV